jgi:hypothetical protein
MPHRKIERAVSLLPVELAPDLHGRALLRSRGQRLLRRGHALRRQGAVIDIKLSTNLHRDLVTTIS